MTPEVVGPLLSIYRLCIDGAKKLLEQGKVREERSLKRWLIEVQLRLENLIDESRGLVRLLRRVTRRHTLPREDRESIVWRLERVGDLTYDLLHSLVDSVEHTAGNTYLKVLGPELRRRIINLTRVRGGIIRDLLRHYGVTPNSKGPLEVQVFPRGWNHSSFESDEDYPFRWSHQASNTVRVEDAVGRYEEVLHELRECSKEMSDLIRTHVDLEDILLFNSRSS